MTLQTYRKEWLGNIRKDILAGMVATFALIPEVIAFSFVAGVAPEVGLYASFVISTVIAFTGGRPGMISGAAGSVALVAASLVKAHGIDYLIATTLFAGVLQIIFGVLKLHVLMNYVSRPVRTGFVNALAILIFSAQLPHLINVSWQTYALTALGLIIIYLLPKVTTLIPSPLIAIIVLTLISLGGHLPVHNVADLGALPTGLPTLTLPHLPLTFKTLGVITPYAVAMAMVGLLESMMTASVVDDLTESHSSKRMECTGLGISNIAVGLFGGIAGCGMIGQTVGNLRYGGRGRLSTFIAGVFLLLLMDSLRPIMAQIPVAALVAIMIMVSISTFSWESFKEAFYHPKTSTLIMLMTVAVVVITHNLALGVLVGVVLNGLFFAWQVSTLVHVSSTLDTSSGKRCYKISGHIFFASSNQLADAIDTTEDIQEAEIDLSEAHFWDITALTTFEEIVKKMQAHHITVNIIGVDAHNSKMLQKYTYLPL